MLARRTPAALSHRAVADRLHAYGYRAGDLPSNDAAFAVAIARAFDRTEVRLGQVPATPDDFAEIRFEHRLLTEAAVNPPPTAHAMVL